jgi:mRNA interferase MazF
MGTPSLGDVVIIPFPYSDLSQSKRRPALVIAEAGRGDLLLCQITSNQIDVFNALCLKGFDFISGAIKPDIFIRGTKLFTANESLILGVAGHLTHSKVSEVICQLIEMLSACLKDHTY